MKDNLELLHDRYARALFECAEADGTADKVMEELSILSTEYLKDKELNRLLIHPLITSGEKKAVIEKLLRNKKKCCRTILNFIKVLIDNKRGDLIHAVFLRYRDLYEEFKNEIRVYVEVPRPFTREEMYLLKDILKSKFLAIGGREEVNVELRENLDLIGGIFIKYKDKIYDYSVRSQLNNMMRGLTR